MIIVMMTNKINVTLSNLFIQRNSLNTIRFNSFLNFLTINF